MKRDMSAHQLSGILQYPYNPPCRCRGVRQGRQVLHPERNFLNLGDRAHREAAHGALQERSQSSILHHIKVLFAVSRNTLVHSRKILGLFDLGRCDRILRPDQYAPAEPNNHSHIDASTIRI